jgi:ADP-heptose:LPS heptosyltransferase
LHFWRRFFLATSARLVLDSFLDSFMMSKRLAIRLSSLGDVILASAALEVPRRTGERWDWLTLPEYASLLEGHPGVGKVWTFDRKSGLAGWIRLAQELYRAEYDVILDLHRSHRTRVLKLCFRVLLFARSTRRRLPNRAGGARHRTIWKTVSKQRFRLYGYFLFKAVWPKAWRPERWVVRHALIAGGTGAERPDLTHLVESGLRSSTVEGLLGTMGQRDFLCVMPGARWDGKKWPVARFRALLERLGMSVVVLGSKDDSESHALVAALETLRREGQLAESAVGRLSFKETAAVLSRSVGFVGNDTGLAHLAEAVGVPVLVSFGPTAPDMGFGPWRERSAALRSSLWCSPCGKDGRYCFRVKNRYQCLQSLDAERAFAQVPAWLKKKMADES